MQSAEIYAWPLTPASRPLPPDLTPPPHFMVRGHSRNELKIRDISRRFDIADRDQRYQLSYIRAQVTHSGFPLPKNDRIVKGVPKKGVEAIHKFSVWDADLVECWFDNSLPPPQRAATEDMVRERQRQALAARARELAA